MTTPKTQQTYSYDEAGQLLQQKNGAGDTTVFEYDTLGNQIRRQDARGFNTYYEYDNAGHKIREVDANQKQQTWSYDADGRLTAHTDLGGHRSTYEYNSNGMLRHERSTHGKSISYVYLGDGQLLQYVDEACGEAVRYDYDAEGQMLSKNSTRTGSAKETWFRETDYYQYDALGRLVQVRRRNPENNTDNRFPEEDKALLSVDYDYDRLGNIRHTKVRARYKTHPMTSNEDYYLYDENSRMTTSKGQLVNGNIIMTSTQGSTLAYDAAGNTEYANKYENGALQQYHYVYNLENQLELLQKNNRSVQSKTYDAAGRIQTERSFDSLGELAQKNTMTYLNGTLQTQITHEAQHSSIATYEYSNEGNIKSWRINTHGGSSNKEGSTILHEYTYESWDSYLQSQDKVTFSAHNSTTTHGKNTRTYDKNGLLEDSIDLHKDDNNQSNTIHYLNSSIDGLRAKEDKDGQTGYLSVAGKTIGDIRLDHSGKQTLTILQDLPPQAANPDGNSPPKTCQTQWRIIKKYTNHLNAQQATSPTALYLNSRKII